MVHELPRQVLLFSKSSISQPEFFFQTATRSGNRNGKMREKKLYALTTEARGHGCKAFQTGLTGKQHAKGKTDLER
jgi:hypothetical protein